MDQIQVDLIAQTIDKRIQSNKHISQKDLMELSKSVALSVYRYLFNEDLNIFANVKQSYIGNTFYDSNTKSIYLSQDFWQKSNIGNLIYNLTHETIHHVQNIAKEKFKQSQDKNILSLSINLTNIPVICRSQSLSIHNYFYPSSEVNYGGFVETGEACYKMQPVEFQARYITFEIFNKLSQNSSLRLDVRDQIQKSLYINDLDNPIYLSRQSIELYHGVDLRKEIDNLILMLADKEKHFIDPRVINTFLKSQTIDLNSKELEVLKEHLQNNSQHSENTFQIWDDIDRLPDLQILRNELEKPLSNWEVKVLKTLMVDLENNFDKREERHRD